MDIYNWKIFNKRGSYVNWYKDSYLTLEFITDAQNSIGAEGYCLTDPSGLISNIIITNSGWNYDPNNTTAILNYTFSQENETSHIFSNADSSIFFKDVSVFDPEPRVSQGIASMTIDLSTSFIYPGVTYAGAFFLDPVGVGLVETEHLTILQETSTGELIRPYDTSTQLIFRFVDTDKEIKLFTVNEEEQIVEWSDELIYDTNIISNIPIVLNIGFRAEDDGVFERRLRVYERRIDDGSETILAEFIVNAQSIPQEERFDTLLQDLAPLLNAKDIPHLFKEANINEALPDWELINYKSKHAILDYSQITPFIGTYKALINAIKWLGYEDIKVKEWFRNVKDGNKLGLYVPYEAEERTKTILYFSAEERKNLKKLNELSLVYCINRDTGTIDDWGNPITENCYEYNLDEVLTKLFALKNWLEINIIGVNARIVDLTGEGIYYERFRNILYGTQDIGTRAEYVQSITPITLGDKSELVRGDASINLTLREFSKTQIQDFSNFRFRDLIDYGYAQDPSLYDPCTGTYTTIPNDASIINNLDASLIRVGATFRNPFYNLYDLQWRASVENTDSGVLVDQFVTNPLWIYDNDIRYYNIYDDEAVFYDISTNLDLVLEQAYFRDASNDIWEDSIAYTISLNSNSGFYQMESSMGVITEFADYAIFSPTKGRGTGENINYTSAPWLGGTYVEHDLTNAFAIVFNATTGMSQLDVSIAFSSDNSSAYICYLTETNINQEPDYIKIKSTQSFVSNQDVAISFTGLDLPPGYYSLIFESQTDLGVERQRISDAGTTDYIGWSSNDRNTWISTPGELGVALFLTANGEAPVLQYNVDANYMAPLLSFKNYKYTDVSGNTQILDENKLFYLDILDGKIAMDASILDPENQVLQTTQYINFNYDTSLLEQKITLNVVYNSERFPLFLYDPSVYYNLTINNYQDPSASLVIDNSVYNMHVNHIGDYFLEVFGWDGQNVVYNNIYKEEDGTYPIWTKYPEILGYIDSSFNNGWEYDASYNYLTDSSLTLLYNDDNQIAIFDRLVPLQGLTLEYDGNNRPFINVPSITFFQDVPDPKTFGKFYNLTERCVSINSSTEIIIDPDYQTFLQDDSINLVLFNKGNYDILDQSTNSIGGIIGNVVTLNDPLPSNFILDQSTLIYLENDSLRETSNIINDNINQTIEIDISNYIFGENQLVGIIIDDISTGYSWGSSLRVIDVSGYTHTFEGGIPNFVVDASDRYTIKAKHGFSTFSSFQIEIENAQEIGNYFQIYLNDIYYHQYYLDNTFVFMNILFDQEKVVEQWYDASDGLINGAFYPFDTALKVDPSTLVVLRAVYDPSTYMLNQKNIWTIKDHDSGNTLMRVFNDMVFYIFDASGTYNITAEAYDSFGNLRTQVFDGLITVE